MSKFKAIIEGLAQTVYNLGNDGEFSSLLQKEGDDLSEKAILDYLKAKDAERVSSLRKEYSKEGYSRAEREQKEAVEKKLKERFELTSSKKGDDLIDEILESVSQKKTSGRQHSDEDVKKHPLYIQMEGQFKSQFEQQKKDFEDQIRAKESEYQKREVFGAVSKEALRIFEGMNPILSSDPAKATNQKADFVSKLSGYDFDQVEGKTIISKDGKILEDAHGHKVDFDSFIKSTADKYFDFKVSEERTAPEATAKKDTDTSKPKFNGTVPKTKDEYLQFISNPNIPGQERIAMRQAAPPEFVNS